MGNAHKVMLIEGSFSPEDAREIVIRLISDKIKFHELKNFSSQERFGKSDLISQKRLPELLKSLKELNHIFEIADRNKAVLRINSEIIIHIESDSSGKDSELLKAFNGTA